MARAQDNRPLSPHVAIYRWQISNGLSILHRITGFGLALGLFLFAAWIWSAAYSAACYEAIQDFASTYIGKAALFGWTLAFFYHFGNGIRHLNWDMGRGFALPDARASGIVVVIFALSATIFTWALILREVGL